MKSSTVPSWIWPLLLILLSIGASLQSYWLPKGHFGNDPHEYTAYNNYVIFKRSFHHLLEQKSLYRHYPLEHWDLYKYSPTFALVFGLLAKMPDWMGLVFWNLLNVLVWWQGVRKWTGGLGGNSPPWFPLWMGLAALELLTSLQNEQSNALVCGMLLWAWSLWEDRRPGAAIGLIMATGFIKIFGFGALLLGLLYPDKVRNTLKGLLWTVGLLALPLLVTDPTTYAFQGREYLRMLGQDHSQSLGISAMGFLDKLHPGFWNKTWVLGISLVVTLIPWLRGSFRGTRNQQRADLLTALMVWMVVFNHKAESPTYVIAVTPALAWLLTRWNQPYAKILLVSAIVLTVLSPTDLFPVALRKSVVEPWHLKAVPCLLTWIAMQVTLYKEAFGGNPAKETEVPNTEQGSPEVTP